MLALLSSIATQTKINSYAPELLGIQTHPAWGTQASCDLQGELADY